MALEMKQWQQPRTHSQTHTEWQEAAAAASATFVCSWFVNVRRHTREKRETNSEVLSVISMPEGDVSFLRGVSAFSVCLGWNHPPQPNWTECTEAHTHSHTFGPHVVMINEWPSADVTAFHAFFFLLIRLSRFRIVSVAVLVWLVRGVICVPLVANKIYDYFYVYIRSFRSTTPVNKSPIRTHTQTTFNCDIRCPIFMPKIACVLWSTNFCCLFFCRASVRCSQVFHVPSMMGYDSIFFGFQLSRTRWAERSFNV